MFRYQGTFNVVCRKRVEGRMTRVNMGDIHANSKKEAKREANRKFSSDCDTGRPVVTFVKGDGLMDQMKKFIRRGRFHEKAPILSDTDKERRNLQRASINVGVRKDLSSSERTKRRLKGKQARQSRKNNR